MKVVFTAMAKELYYFESQISTFVFNEGSAVPVNPFLNFGYFLGDNIERDVIRQANDELIGRADELWVFIDVNEIADGVSREIELASQLKKDVRFYRVEKSKTITRIVDCDPIPARGASDFYGFVVKGGKVRKVMGIFDRKEDGKILYFMEPDFENFKKKAEEAKKKNREYAERVRKSQRISTKTLHTRFDC
jgi:hypothetical protein